MCKQCHRARRRQLAVLVLTPALIVGQPVTHDLRILLANHVDPSQSFTLQLGGVAHATEAQAATDPGTIKYTCPMHPHYIADEMGTCPICGMDLVKLQTDGAELGATSGESRTIVTVPTETIQNMGVRLGKAEVASFGRSIRSFGIVHANERRQTEITARVEGWIEDLKVRAVGDVVRKGDLLFKLYSPQLIVSQGDFQRSRGTRDLAGRGEGQLRAFGVQRRVIEDISKRQRPIELVPFYAEQDGTVAELELREGTYVKRGMMLAQIQDYSQVWLRVGVSEQDLGFITKDTMARVAFPNLAGRDVMARVDFVYPTVDTKTRTGQVRLVIANEDGRIRPGSYADVTFEVGVQRRLAVPSDAILRSGAGRHVVVSLGEGRFEPRLVEAGLTSDGRTEIKSGVSQGEDIVVSGQFMLDSESALRESFRKMERLQVPLSLLKLTKTEFAMIDHLIDASLYAHEALVDGYDIDPKQLEPAAAIKEFMWPRYKDTQLAFVLTDATAAVRKLQVARSESELQAGLAAVNATLRAWVLEGAPAHYRSKNLAVFKDPMSNRIWFQVGQKPINPYARGGGELIAYRETKTTAATSADAPGKATKAAATVPPTGGLQSGN